MQTLVRGVGTLLCGLFFSVVFAASAAAQPSVLTLSDEDTTVHLLGTLHLMPPETDWQTDEIRDIISSADAVYLEADTVNADQVAMQQYIIANGTNPPGVFLSSLMTHEQYQEFSAYTEEFGLSAAALEGFRPWYAALTLGVVQIMAEGYNPEEGVDTALHQAAVIQGTELRFLETMEFQLGLFAGFSAELELDMLLSTVAGGDEIGTMLDAMFNAWMSGDYEQLDLVVNEETRSEYPEMFAAIYTNRNATWADEITSLMANEPGIFVVAVGSGHMGGPGSLPDILRQRGFTVE